MTRNGYAFLGHAELEKASELADTPVCRKWPHCYAHPGSILFALEGLSIAKWGRGVKSRAYLARWLSTSRRTTQDVGCSLGSSGVSTRTPLTTKRSLKPAAKLASSTEPAERSPNLRIPVHSRE